MKVKSSCLPAAPRPAEATGHAPGIPAPEPQPRTPKPKSESPGPAPRAWADDPFWRDVVRAYAGGKKLYASHYLENLTAPELAQLREALSSTGSLRVQQQRCPRRRGGDFDGELPDLMLLSRLATAIRQAAALGDATLKTTLETAQAHCQRLGLEPDITNRILRSLASEVLDNKVRCHRLAVGIANCLLRGAAESARERQNEACNKFRERTHARLDETLELAWARHEFNAAKRVLKVLPEVSAIQKDNTLNDFEKINEIRLKLFGRIAEHEPQF